MFSILCIGRFGRLKSSSLVTQFVNLSSSSGRVDFHTTERPRNWYQRKRHDPIWLENRRARNRQLENEKLARDPDYRETRHRTNREKYATGDYKARFHLQRMLYDWCKRKIWIRELPWKTHTPIFYPDSIELHCTGCGHARAGGSKLFWLARDSGHRLCNGCYAGKGWTDVMPAGYDDCRTQREIAARKQQLDGINPSKLP